MRSWKSLPLSPNVQEHDDEGIEIPLRDFIKKNTVTPTIETERGHKYPRHGEIGYREMPTEPWMRRDTDRKLPATDRVMMDIVQATTKLTVLEKMEMFHIDTGRPVCIRDRGTKSPLSVSHLTEIKDMHGTQTAREAIMHEPESDGMTQS